jgi:hypothetical protein
MAGIVFMLVKRFVSFFSQEFLACVLVAYLSGVHHFTDVIQSGTVGYEEAPSVVHSFTQVLC